MILIIHYIRKQYLQKQNRVIINVNKNVYVYVCIIKIQNYYKVLTNIYCYRGSRKILTTLHIVLKSKYSVKHPLTGEELDNITEHKESFEKKKRLIWGQTSNKSTSGVTKKKRDRLQEQIADGIDTYTFFLANDKGNRELYVGKMTNIYDKKEIPEGSPLTEFVPNYYSTNVGTENDRCNLYVDVNTFIKVDIGYLDNMTIESSGNSIPLKKNSTPTFLVNINNELNNLLTNIINNPESNYQYQVEQEEVPNDVIINDHPRDKQSKQTGRKSGKYNRNSLTAKKAIVSAKYKCEIDGSHEEFVSRATGENYVEAHHLIPIGYQDDFTKSIDVEANIVSLCAGCHRKLHHATYTDIKPLIEHLYSNRINRLKDCEIEISKGTLLGYYK